MPRSLQSMHSSQQLLTASYISWEGGGKGVKQSYPRMRRKSKVVTDMAHFDLLREQFRNEIQYSQGVIAAQSISLKAMPFFNHRNRRFLQLFQNCGDIWSISRGVVAAGTFFHRCHEYPMTRKSGLGLRMQPLLDPWPQLLLASSSASKALEPPQRLWCVQISLWLCRTVQNC